MTSVVMFTKPYDRNGNVLINLYVGNRMHRSIIAQPDSAKVLFFIRACKQIAERKGSPLYRARPKPPVATNLSPFRGVH